MKIMKQKHSFWASVGFAWNGIRAAWSSQRNLKIQTVIAALIVVAGFIFKLERWEWCVVLICIGGVIALELINTAIEHLTDLVQPERHPLAGKVKDISAAAVLWFSMISAVVGFIIFAKHIF